MTDTPEKKPDQTPIVGITYTDAVEPEAILAAAKKAVPDFKVSLSGVDSGKIIQPESGRDI
jgi:hypothetical protein